ncbi:MAG: DNA-protecting protein DprA [Spirochaetales bacterium]|nr:DNA-protecting protein DprA [Spirochaetales bacterium]
MARGKVTPVRHEDANVRGGDEHNWRERLVSRALKAARPDEDALLLVARFRPLRPLERLSLLLAVPRLRDLLASEHYDVERIIQRPLRKTRWNPRDLLRAVEADLRWAAKEERRVVWIADREYPAPLTRLFDPPPILYVWGTTAALGRHSGVPHAIAMVGTRRPDEASLAAAYEAGRSAAEHGLTVVSGLALGIDGAVHRGAVASGTDRRAVAVLGSGIDSVYPVRHRDLAADILDRGGAILSEYPPGTPAQRYQFPARNRIVAGLSSGVVLFQAPERSGALITVEFASQIGAAVMVHRSAAISPGGARCLADGADEVSGVADIVDCLRASGVPVVGERDGSPRAAVPGRGVVARFGPVDPPGSLGEARRVLRRRIGEVV